MKVAPTGVGAGNFVGLQKIFCPNLPEKLLCDKVSPYKFSVAVGTLYFIYKFAVELKIENWYLKFCS